MSKTRARLQRKLVARKDALSQLVDNRLTEDIADEKFRHAFTQYTGIDPFDTSPCRDEDHRVESLALQYKFAVSTSSPATLEALEGLSEVDRHVMTIAASMKRVALQRIRALREDLQRKINLRIMELPEAPSILVSS